MYRKVYDFSFFCYFWYNIFGSIYYYYLLIYIYVYMYTNVWYIVYYKVINILPYILFIGKLYRGIKSMLKNIR
jgi:hypothetical protein